MMKPNWNKSGKPLHQKTLKDFNPTIFHIIIYEKYDTNIGMLEMDDLDLWYYFMILYYDSILWWNLRWNIMMKHYDLNLCDDGWWSNDVGWWCMKWCGLFCVDTVMKWYEMLWKWTVVNDEMMEVDGMNLGVFVSSYMYIYNFFNYMKTLEL